MMLAPGQQRSSRPPTTIAPPGSPTSPAQQAKGGNAQPPAMPQQGRVTASSGKGLITVLPTKGPAAQLRTPPVRQLNLGSLGGDAALVSELQQQALELCHQVEKMIEIGAGSLSTSLNTAQASFEATIIQLEKERDQARRGSAELDDTRSAFATDRSRALQEIQDLRDEVGIHHTHHRGWYHLPTARIALFGILHAARLRLAA